MTIRYLYIISLILTVFNGGLLAQKKVFNLQECVDTALYHNRNIKQQELNKKLVNWLMNRLAWICS